MVWWIVSSDRNAPGAGEMIASISPSLNRSQMDQVSVKLADCDNKTYRDCLSTLKVTNSVISSWWDYQKRCPLHYILSLATTNCAVFSG